ncbi:neutral zinc metallopeptidase [uncultured Pseudoteredinibacter sp.]|uniref:KPN_02809 family neutral zinc metallopeptidase n=1 Tax=uncultured Pseudoteredinibacter sp. TaxID=1641701 RepID=UPI0026265F7C|nr:neutral zinc metallopeptidase [uncultured Pseudoteredinibacter sp.]
MKWRDSRRSDNVDDQRNNSPSQFGGGGSIANFLPIIRMLIGTKVGRIVLAVGAIAYFLGFNPLSLLQPGQQGFSQAKVQNSPEDNLRADFVTAVLGQTEDVWGAIFQKSFGKAYPQPRLVLFRNGVRSACGQASSAMGPFYCPADNKVYLDLGFFDELARRHGAPGDFAQAYVIAHEVGHHLQNVFGVLDKTHQAKRRLSKTEGNALQVRVELQADCYAGVWAHHAQKQQQILEAGDVEEALQAASAIGDDTLQKQAQGYVVPDAFTHGSAEQRIRWFKNGLQQGSLQSCDTFKAAKL